MWDFRSTSILKCFNSFARYPVSFGFCLVCRDDGKIQITELCTLLAALIDHTKARLIVFSKSAIMFMVDSYIPVVLCEVNSQKHYL